RAQLLEEGPVHLLALVAKRLGEVLAEVGRYGVVVEQRVVHVEEKDDVAHAATSSSFSGVSSLRESMTTSAAASPSGAGGNSRLGVATPVMPAAFAAKRLLVEPSTAAAVAGSTPSRRAASR